MEVEMIEDNVTADALRIYERWHETAKSHDVPGTLALYTEDAVLETPLVLAIYPERDSAVLRGRQQIEEFFIEGTRRRPNDLVRWYRTGTFFSNGRQLVWEYPREAPDGDQVDILEVMDIEDGLITHHRIYWGWFGVRMLTASIAKKHGGYRDAS
jgi:hypothetical protein